MASPIALVKPELLRWARTSAGLTTEVAARKAVVKAEVLAGWENGSSAPTIPQLRKLANIYKRPLAVFFLPAPPRGWDVMRDERRVDPGATSNESPALLLAIRETWERRDVVVDLSDELEIKSALDVTAHLEDDPELVAADLRDALDVSEAEQHSWPTPDSAFGKWRFAVERKSILVFSFPSVDVHEIRGFSISQPPIWAIAINSSDQPAAKTFTLMHELSHLALRSGAVMCEPIDHAATQVETFCNHVAGALLVPRDALMRDTDVRQASASRVWSDQELTRLSRRFLVSREVVLRRLLILGKTSTAEYQARRTVFESEFLQWAAKRKRTQQERDGGPGYLETRISQMGRMYAGTVLDAYSRGSITLSDTCGYLGVKTNHIPKIQEDPTLRAG